MANSVDLDQTALSEAVWSGYPLFAYMPFCQKLWCLKILHIYHILNIWTNILASGKAVFQAKKKHQKTTKTKKKKKTIFFLFLHQNMYLGSY